MLTTRKLWLGAMLLIMIGLLLTGCTPAQPPLIMPTALPLPVRPVLPSITATDLTCLSDETYSRLASRNRLQRHYAEKLEVIIKSTRPFDSAQGAKLTPHQADKGLALSGVEAHE